MQPLCCRSGRDGAEAGRSIVKEHGVRRDAARQAMRGQLDADPELFWILFEPRYEIAFAEAYDRTVAALRSEGYVPKASQSVPQGQIASADGDVMNASGEVVESVPKGQRGIADPDAIQAAAEASDAVPQGQRRIADAAAPDAGEGEADEGESQGRHLGADPSPATDVRGEVGAEDVAPQGQEAPADPSPRATQRPSRLRYANRDDIKEKIAVRRLWEFRIYGDPIATVTRGRALTWARHSRVGARFVELLCAALPTDESKIGDYYTDAEEVERIWRVAEERGANA